MAKKQEKQDARAERLSKICASINGGTFGGAGKDAVTWLGSRDVIQIERFSSGCIDIDEALGGGYPKGRFIEIFGPESGGKCVTADTYVYGVDGLVTIEEMFAKMGHSTTCTSRVKECSYDLVGDDIRSKMEGTTHFTWNNRKPVNRIITNGGLELNGTLNHPIRIISNDGIVSWRKIQDIQIGDQVLVIKGMMVDPASNGCDEDDATLLALVIAEGHITNNRVGFTNANIGMLETFENLMLKKFGFSNIRKYSRTNDKTGIITWDYHCNSKELVSSFIERYGKGCCGLSGDKFVPYCIRTAPLSVQIEFLRYYFLCEGSVDKTRSRLEMTSKSKTMIRQIQMLSLNLGAFGRMTPKEVDGEIYWRLTIDGTDALKWQDSVAISTLFPEKTVAVHRDHGRTIPGSMMAKSILADCSDADRILWDLFDGSVSDKCGITEVVWAKFMDIKSNYQFGSWATSMIGYINSYIQKGWDFDVVKSVETLDAVPTFDVVKPDHIFWSNGLVSHNTTATLHAVAEHQKKYPDEDCALIDTEFSFDESYAQRLGVNTKYLIVHQPESGEQALNILKQLLQAGVTCLIIDSVAALTTKAELEGDIGDTHVGEQARLMSQALKQLAAEAGKRNATVFWTNQIREKIGICFQYHVPVLLEDGTTEWIGNIVNNKMPVRVMSYNQKTGKIEPRKITGWFKNGVLGKDDEFVRIRAAGNIGPSKGGNRTITCTKNHMIFTPTGEVEADTLNVGDLVLVNDWKYYTPEQHEILLGSILGDGGLRFEKNSPRGHMRFLHGPDQAEYCKWKANVFGEKANTAKSGNVWFDTSRTQEMERYKTIGKKKGVRCFPDSFVPMITRKAVAIWYQDDGGYGGSHEKWGWGNCSIGAQCLSKRTLDLIAEHLSSLGLGNATVKEGKGLFWFGKESRKFQMGIAKYVHPSMRYKIKHDMPEFNWDVRKMEPVEIGYPRVVTKKEYWTPPPGRRGLFDIEVDGHHSYVAGGIVVHNSYGDKTTTPAGRALRHYASIRMHIRAIGKVKEKVKGEDVVVSSRNKIDVKKNKVAPPFKTAEFCITFGHGIDTIAAVLDSGISMKIVEKRGAWLAFGSEQLGCGRAVSLEVLRKNPDLVQKISDAIVKAKEAGIEPVVADDVEVMDPNAGADPDAVGAADEGAEVADV